MCMTCGVLELERHYGDGPLLKWWGLVGLAVVSMMTAFVLGFFYCTMGVSDNWSWYLVVVPTTA